MYPYVIATLLLTGGALAAAPTSHQLECMACEDGVGLLEFALSSDLVEGSLKHLIDEACASLSAPYAADCKATVDEGFPLIIKDINSFLNVTCSRTLGCTSKDVALGKLQTIMHPDVPTQSDFTVCSIFETLYKNLPTEVKYFAAICPKLPAAEVQGCEQFFQQHPEMVVQLAEFVLKKLVSMPFLDCKLTVAEPVAVLDDTSLECMACNEAVGLLNFMLESPLAVNSLKHVIGEACAKLSPPYAADCNSTVQSGIDLIVKDIISFTDKICPSTLHCPTPSPIAKKSFDSVSGDYCSLIQRLYNDVPSAVNYFRNICPKLPTTTMQQDCVAMFTNDNAGIVAMGEEIVAKLADMVPFVHCTIA